MYGLGADSGAMPFTDLTYVPTDAQLLEALQGTTASTPISGTSSALSSSVLWMAAAGVGLLFVVLFLGKRR